MSEYTGGVLVFYFEAGNAASEAHIINAARQHVGYTVIAMPRAHSAGGAGVEYFPDNREVNVAMLALLKNLEWTGRPERCPVCRSYSDTGHTKTCELNGLKAALEKMPIATQQPSRYPVSMIFSGFRGEALELDSRGRLRRPWNNARADTGDNMPIPHVISYASIISGAYRTYYHGRQDEAYRHSREDALVMVRDCFLMSLLEERMRRVSTLPWHLTVPDEKNADQKLVRDHIKTTLDNMRGKDRSFRRFIKWGLWKLWFGRMGAQVRWRWEQQAGLKTLTVAKALPINGDKIIYKWNQMPAVQVNAVEDLPGAEYIPATNEGARAILLKGSWRNKFAIFTHDQEDSDFFDIDRADAIHGVGIRSKVFWLNWIRLEWESRVASFFDSLGTGGFLVFYFEQGNAESEAQVTTASTKYSGFTKLLIPRSIAAGGAGVEFHPVNMNGVEALNELRDVIREDITHYIKGSRESKTAGNDQSIISKQQAEYNTAKDDAELLAEELTGDADNPSLIYMIQTHTFPDSAPWKPGGFPVRLKFDLPNVEAKDMLAAAEQVFDMGITLDAGEVREKAGFSKPTEGAEVIGGPEYAEKPNEKQPSNFPPGKPGEKKPGEEKPAEEKEAGQEEDALADLFLATAPDQYADDDGQWITIGGHAEGDEKHVGGFHVKVDGEGRITAGGTTGLHGKKVGEVKQTLDRVRGKVKKNVSAEPVGTPNSEAVNRIEQALIKYGVYGDQHGWDEATKLTPRQVANAAKKANVPPEHVQHLIDTNSTEGKKKALDQEIQKVVSGPIESTLDALRGVLNKIPHGAAPVAAMDAVLKGKGRDDGDGALHGMTQPEHFQEMQVDGAAIRWEAKSEKTRQAAAESLAIMTLRPLPKKLMAATHSIYFTEQRNKDDSHWEKEYNRPGFKSAATGGDGGVMVYNGYPTWPGVIAHEAGHNLAQQLWHSYAPPHDSDYGQAQQAEPPVTEYAANGPHEDFAEACKMYVTEKEVLQQKFPRKYAALHAIIGDG